MNGQQPQTFDANTPLTMELTLSIAQWQVVLNLLPEAPWKIAHPLIMGIQPQLKKAIDGERDPDVQRPAQLVR